MGAHARLFGVAAAVVICGNLTASAQWRGVVTKGVPLNSGGTPNLEAPAPRLADGKTPDFSGINERPLGRVPLQNATGGTP